MNKLRNFLRWIGWLFVGLGVLGYLIGSSWAPTLIYSANESLAYLVVGAVLLAAAYWGKTASLLKWLTILVGVAGVYFAAYGWFVSSNYYNLASLEGLDNILLLLVGVWALWLVWGKKR